MRLLTLSSGKQVSFDEYGDLHGKPVFLLHGWPGSRLQGERLQKLCKVMGIRLICPDRPGFGHSEFDSNRALLGYAKNVEEIANNLDIKRFSIMGVSGGGPYAAACAYTLEKRLHKVGIIVGLAPTSISGVLQGMAPINKATWYLYHYVPGLIYASSFLQYIRKWILPKSTSGSLASSADKKLVDEKLGLLIARNRAEAFRQGILGAAHDLKLYTHDWGFDVSQINVPVFLYYGALDKNVSVKMGEYYHEHIRGSVLKVYPDAGHLVLDMYAKEILSDLSNQLPHNRS
jgi:pimeloyl-ACP methyl ester carboxylesterase